MVAHALLGLAAVACSRGGMSEAIEFLVPAVLLEESLGFRFEEDEQRRVHAVLDSARAAMSSEEFDAAWKRAKERTVDEILEGLASNLEIARLRFPSGCDRCCVWGLLRASSHYLSRLRTTFAKAAMRSGSTARSLGMCRLTSGRTGHS